jgi:hypothetical protein
MKRTGECTKHQKVIKRNQLQATLPTTATISMFLLLDRFHAPGWLWGAMGLLFAIFWVGAIYAMCVQEAVQLKELTSNDVDQNHG